jgi:hypothetical protein
MQSISAQRAPGLSLAQIAMRRFGKARTGMHYGSPSGRPVMPRVTHSSFLSRYPSLPGTTWFTAEVGMARVRRPNVDVSKLARIVTDHRACRDLQLYFGVGLGGGELPPYAGGRFELLDGGGDRADVCNRFTASDIGTGQGDRVFGTHKLNQPGDCVVGVLR